MTGGVTGQIISRITLPGGNREGPFLRVANHTGTDAERSIEHADFISQRHRNHIDHGIVDHDRIRNTGRFDRLEMILRWWYNAVTHQCHFDRWFIRIIARNDQGSLVRNCCGWRKCHRQNLRTTRGDNRIEWRHRKSVSQNLGKDYCQISIADIEHFQLSGGRFTNDDISEVPFRVGKFNIRFGCGKSQSHHTNHHFRLISVIAVNRASADVRDSFGWSEGDGESMIIAGRNNSCPDIAGESCAGVFHSGDFQIAFAKVVDDDISCGFLTNQHSAKIIRNRIDVDFRLALRYLTDIKSQLRIRTITEGTVALGVYRFCWILRFTIEIPDIEDHLVSDDITGKLECRITLPSGKLEGPFQRIENSSGAYA